MKLGMISWITEDCFRNVKEKGLEFIELCVNDRAEEFLTHQNEIKEYIARYELPILSVGRWGGNRISVNGICKEEIELDLKLIDAAADIGCPIFVTGCNYVKELSYYENCTLAIHFFEKLIEHANKYGMRVATYNCRWDNFVCDASAYKIIHGYLKDLYIKYDPSHCFYSGEDYLKETQDWAERFAHVHIKGGMYINGRTPEEQGYDDPPAGMDMINWPAFMSLLYVKGYEGELSIEPHGKFGLRGLDRTIKHIRSLMLD